MDLRPETTYHSRSAPRGGGQGRERIGVFFKEEMGLRLVRGMPRHAHGTANRSGCRSSGPVLRSGSGRCGEGSGAAIPGRRAEKDDKGSTRTPRTGRPAGGNRPDWPSWHSGPRRYPRTTGTCRSHWTGRGNRPDRPDRTGRGNRTCRSDRSIRPHRADRSGGEPWGDWPRRLNGPHRADRSRGGRRNRGSRGRDPVPCRERGRRRGSAVSAGEDGHLGGIHRSRPRGSPRRELPGGFGCKALGGRGDQPSELGFQLESERHLLLTFTAARPSTGATVTRPRRQRW